MPQQEDLNRRILVLMDHEEEVDTIQNALSQYVQNIFICRDKSQLLQEIPRGLSVLLLSRKLLSEDFISQLTGRILNQPSWAKLNVLSLFPRGGGYSAVSVDSKLRSLLQVVEVPLEAEAVVQQVLAATADRERQYQVRDLMRDLELSGHAAVEATRAKGDFLANMSHEIRTPLGAILGFAELLMDSGISKQEKRDYMIAARRNGQMLSALIDDILDLSRVEAGRLEVAKIEFSLSELISEVVSALEPLASKKGLPLIVNRPKDIDHIVSDPLRLKQILVNIIGNAIKFTSHGSVELRLELEPSMPGNSILKVEVEDTGIGISPQQVARLFLPFTQVDTSTTRNFGGTGLGLVLSQKLARALGGDLNLKTSVPGGGSVFAISLPVIVVRAMARSRIETAMNKRPVDEKLPLVGSRVLLVDDSLDNQMLISRILKLLGAEVELANDGLEGVDKALAAHFDVVLMDLQMPRLGGVDATRILRSKGYDRPIVALTAHSLQEDRQRCMNVGCTDYLTKPVQRSLLVQVIERAAQRKGVVPTESPHFKH